MKKTKKTKRQKKNIRPVIAKGFFLSVTVAELGAVIALALVQGDTQGTVAKIIAVPLAMDFLIRACKIVQPFFKGE
jgi:hypothetical protein